MPVDPVPSYDASFTKHLETAGVEVILIGDSLGMVMQGHESTLPVTVDDMVYHTSMVSRARERALLIADMPYHSYQNKEQALENAKRLIEEAGADMVKFEGAGELVPIAEHLVKNNIPVCVECKSGEFRQDIDKYLKLRKQLKLSKDQFVVCVFGLSDEQAQGMTSMYDLTFTNEKNLIKQVEKIIKGAGVI